MADRKTFRTDAPFLFHILFLVLWTVGVGGYFEGAVGISSIRVPMVMWGLKILWYFGFAYFFECVWTRFFKG